MGSRTRPYRALLGARMRAQSSYRASFGLDLVSSLLIGLVELAEVWVLYRAVDEIGGLDLTAALVVFGLADTAFSIADLLVGHVDRLPDYLRARTFDVFCLRPQPPSIGGAPAGASSAAVAVLAPSSRSARTGAGR